MARCDSSRGLSGRRRVALTLLGVLVLLAASAYAVFAASTPRFSISAVPASQTITRGDGAAYTITVNRVNGFAEPVTLQAARLPNGAAPSWELSDGTESNVVPPEIDQATLTIQTGAGTPATTTQPVIKATSTELTRRTSVELTVVRASVSNFTIESIPSSRHVLQGDQTSYKLRLDRTRFRGAVDLSVSGLPSGGTASWNPSNTIPESGSSTRLVIETAADTPTGSSTLTVTGTGTVRGEPVERSATMALVVHRTRPFRITGDLDTQLAPGTSAPLDLTLTNPYGFDLQVTDVTVQTSPETSNPGCSGTDDFAITQMASDPYPITLPPNQTMTLSELGVSATAMPRIEMLNQPYNQDACKGATIDLDPSGSATQ